jgi:kynurenine formamidase
MAVLSDLVAAFASGSVEVVDLTAPLSPDTPLLQLPEQFGQTARFELELISRYDDAGPAWYWNNFRTGEHTGTHFDAPIHWVTGRDGADVASVPPGNLIGPAAVLDFSAEAGADPDFLVEIDHIRAWESEHGALPDRGWLLVRTGWDARAHSQDEFLNADENGPHTPGLSAECARWVAQESPVIGMGSRPSAATPAPPRPSSRCSRVTRSCTVRGSTASPSCATSTGCRRPARW